MNTCVKQTWVGHEVWGLLRSSYSQRLLADWGGVRAFH